MTTELASPIHLPDGYRQVLYWKLSGQKLLLVVLNVVALLLMGLVAMPILSWVNLWHPDGFTVSMHPLEILAMVIGVVLTIVIHEWTHGLALRYYGARPRYGILWKEMMFYATAPSYAFRRNHYIVIALAPLVGLGLLGLLLLVLPLPGWLGWTIVFCTVLNTGSSIGDMWLVGVALKYPSRAYIVDERDGLRVFVPGTDA